MQIGKLLRSRTGHNTQHATNFASSCTSGAMMIQRLFVALGAIPLACTPIYGQARDGQDGPTALWPPRAVLLRSGDMTLPTPPRVGRVKAFAVQPHCFAHPIGAESAPQCAPPVSEATAQSRQLVGSYTADFYANPIFLNFGALSNSKNNFGFGPACNVNSFSYAGQLLCGYDSVIITSIGTKGYPSNQFVGHYSFIHAKADVTNKGAYIFAGNDVATIDGTGWTGVIAREIDVTASRLITGTKAGAYIVSTAGDKYQGATDGGLMFYNQAGAVGWKNGIFFGPNTVSKKGCLICTSGPGTAAKGIDGSSYTYSDNVITFPGFAVGHNGDIHGKSLTLDGAAGIFALNNGSFNILQDQVGSQSILLGSGTTYYDQTVHVFRNASGTSTYAVIDSSAANYKVPIRIVPVAFRSLPKCNSAAEGVQATVNDLATAPAFRQTGLTGGGSVYGHLECNGTAWEAH
ncbi:protein of unknown function [Beijerinckiaceae bacterium RH AL1]|nr:protein of unknown function [Beijerinckiaceae bacterium RH AL8]VVB42592.1 protein of unknown function [Beijerinckiaceae bacterium RH CH11]VVC53394.1 protein of unknown function [Beijerinckiaceae bacterium RH AL1]